MKTAHQARLLICGAFIFQAAAAGAEEVKLNCLTERVWLRQGAPPVVLASFDEEAKSAGLFVKEFGGILRGEDVSVFADQVMFNFRTASGDAGKVLISRADGTMMVQVSSAAPLEFLATCRRQVNRF